MAAAGWWTTFFAGSALELWRRAHTRDENRAEAADIARALRLEPGERVLDIPCGNGRLALELAARDLRVCGLDASAELLAEGRRCARERGLEPELVHGDMRALPWRSEFDAAFCVGNSFGYFDPDDNREFLCAVARGLRPSGRFLLEVPLVAELVSRRHPCRDWQLLGERLLLSEAEYDETTRRLETAYTFLDLAVSGGALERRSTSIQVYAARELAELLGMTGFAAIEALGDLDGSPFEADSGQCYLRARRA